MSLSDELLACIQRYKDTASNITERDKAILEKDLWARARKEDPTLSPDHNGKAAWLSTTLNARFSFVVGRGMLLGADAACGELWKRLDEGDIGLNRAYSILKCARKATQDSRYRSEHPTALREAVNAELARYQPSPHMKKARARSPTAPISPATAPTDTLSSKPKSAIRKIMLESMGVARIPEDLARNTLLRHFLTDLDTVYRLYAGRIRAAMPTGGPICMPGDDIPFHLVETACIALNLGRPTRGKPVDIKKASRSLHSLSRMYHPDIVGDDSKVDLLREKLDACALLKKYNGAFDDEAEEAAAEEAEES